MRGIRAVLAITVVAAFATTVTADVTIEFIGDNIYAASISADGSVVVGNTQGDYETFRWTRETGVVALGQATAPVLGVGAGIPQVSADGTRVSATILGADSTYATQGRWTLAAQPPPLGTWQETMPPTPPDGGLLDQAYGSAWGISDDGEVLVGLYWRPGQASTGLAHPCYWTKAGGVVDLGTGGGSGRANDANQDGSVIVGWEEAEFGYWMPTVWVDGVRTNLSTDESFHEANVVNPAGTLVGGDVHDESTELTVGALWRWNGTGWDEQTIGALPGHHGTFGLTTVNDFTPDGSLVVGYDRRSSPGDATGFLWTEDTGIVDVADFLADNGVTVPAGFIIRSLTGISADGRTICGSGEETFPPYSARSFLIHLEHAVDAPIATAPSPSRVRVFPNPTRGATTLALDLPRPASVKVDVFDGAGRLVRRLQDGTSSAARRITWDGRDRSGSKVAAGVYYLRVQADDHLETERLVVIR